MHAQTSCVTEISDIESVEIQSLVTLLDQSPNSENLSSRISHELSPRVFHISGFLCPAENIVAERKMPLCAK